MDGGHQPPIVECQRGSIAMVLMRRQGFTLIELLVVITIMVILIALMLPKLLTTTSAMRAVACFNQMRQIGLGVSSYQSMHNYLPLP